ncbi:MAG TPA: Fur family transcriptional regulator [Geopsychrobacteraceae bacterium]|jgi:Fur family zinc uptake transcriptional regulator
MKKTSHTAFVDHEHDHQGCIAEAVHHAETLCRQRRQRFTAIRRRVLELVWRQHKPIGAYQVLELLQRDGRSAPPTVYRALDFLQQMGLVHRIASLNAYAGCAHPGTVHDGQFLICEACQSLAELDAPTITGAIAESAARSGFAPRRQTVEIMGLCPHCR